MIIWSAPILHNIPTALTQCLSHITLLSATRVWNCSCANSSGSQPYTGYRNNQEENMIAFLEKNRFTYFKKKRRDWDYSRVYSKMRRDFVLLRQQAFFVSDHSNTQNQGSGWLKDMGVCLHKQKSKKFSVPMCNRTQKVHLSLPTLSPGSQTTLEGRIRCAVSWGYLKGFVFLWLNSG